MRSLPLLLLASAFVLAADPCTVIITARPGDTCATISSLAGITVSQFLRANPSVSSCAALVSGARYCVDPGFSPPSSTAASSAPASTSTSTSSAGSGGGKAALEVSTNGQCGGTLTCLSSSYGDCCSEHGWCGGTVDHCSPPGCQAAFGRCDAPASNGTATTVYVTRMTTVVSTVVSTVGGGGAGVTQIVRSTTTVTVPGQTTATVRVTDRTLVVLTSTVTTIKTVVITDARLCRTTTSRTFYKVGGGDSCEGIVRRYRGMLDLGRLYAWNRQLSGDCQGLTLGELVCVGI